MKKIFLFILFSVLFANCYAQANTDSLAYQQQRKKINDMLTERKSKFGEYDQSLGQHSGIFGFRTKKDINNSNEILMQIVATDDDIFQQLKILLDYQNSTQQRVIIHSAQADSSRLGFMNVINKLRAQNEQLKNDATAAEQQQEKSARTSMFIIIGLIVVVLLLLRRQFVKKTR